ncbi:RhoGAP-domain-containing protein [Lichtheimia hyalospora FSU 10163]|nr:RhoGAP-domain-containing protein [Lichtheimia hyalospora FSU 10163]
MVHPQPLKTPTTPAEELAHLRSQNEQLWRIVEKQRVMIHNLQKDNTRLAIERDGLVNKLNAFEKDTSIRSNSKPSSVVVVDDMESDQSLSPDGVSSPVPPPRSPFRRAISDEPSSMRSPPISPPGSTTNVTMDFTASSATRSRVNLLEQERRDPQRTMEMTDRQQGFEHDGDTLILGDITVKIIGSNLKTNNRGKEVISFTIAVGRQRTADLSFHELWRVEKFYSDFLDLDAKLKAQSSPAVASKISRLPEKALFTTNAPSKVDQRKMALEHYLQQTLLLPWEDVTDLCEFLSSNVVKQRAAHHRKRHREGHKEGYLTKRGKNFGGWKTRYFVMNGDMIDYFESKEGSHLGTIRLTNAQIGRQQSSVTTAPHHPTSQADSNDDSSYRHAFLLVEQKRPGSSSVSRHILCAESDQERDEWVDAIVKNVRYDDDSPKQRTKKDKARKSSKSDTLSDNKESSMDVGIAFSNPSLTTMADGGVDPTYQHVLPNTMAADYGRCSLDHSSLPTHPHNTTQPTTPQLAHRSSMINFGTGSDPLGTPPRAPSPSLGNNNTYGRISEDLPDDSNDKKKTKTNRMTFWGRKKTTNDNPPNQHPPSSSSGNSTLQADAITTPTNARTSMAPTGLRSLLSRASSETDRQTIQQQQRSYNNNYPNAKGTPQNDASGPNQVFGVPLEEAVRVSRAAEGYELPSVVYRCIQYLDAKNAATEEGLYRLSGSSKVMKTLQYEFNQRGDIDLLASEEEYDVHAIAGLLKLWLRELPSNVLTRERYTDFLHVIDLLDRKDRVNELGRLVSELPLANYTLLRALIAHLLCVVQHSDINKMTTRNVSIVFSPTLGIPAMIFNLFLSEFNYVFWTDENGEAAPRTMDSTMTTPSSTIPVVTELSPAPKKMIRKPTLKLREESGRTNRNSVSYVDGAPAAMVDLERNKDGPLVLDDEDEEGDELTLQTPSQDHSISPTRITTQY